jgi:hypothetical protein
MVSTVSSLLPPNSTQQFSMNKAQRNGAKASPETFKIFSNTAQEVLIHLTQQMANDLKSKKNTPNSLGVFYSPQLFFDASIQHLDKVVKHIEPHVLRNMEKVKSSHGAPRLIQTPPAQEGSTLLDLHKIVGDSYAGLMNALAKAEPSLVLTNPRKKLSTKTMDAKNPGLRFSLGSNRIVLKANEFKPQLQRLIQDPVNAPANLFGALPHNIEHAKTKSDLLRGPLDDIF